MDRLDLDERFASALKNFTEAVTTAAEDTEHNEATTDSQETTTDVSREYPYAREFMQEMLKVLLLKISFLKIQKLLVLN